MKLNNGSLCFGSIIEKGGGTPSWSTDLGERRPDLKITYEGCDNILKGMDYKSIPLFAVACNLGKGGALNIGSQSPLFRKAALFEKVFINNIHVGYPFILLMLSDYSESWYGRLNLKYSPNAKVFGEIDNGKINYLVATKELADDGQKIIASNEIFFQHAVKILNITTDACWFINEIDVVNQDELHMKANVVDATKNVYYPSTQKRNEAWESLIEPQLTFNVETFFNKLDFSDSGLVYNESIVKRFVSAILSKSFVVLTGLSGSGKTKLAQAFVSWISKNFTREECFFKKGGFVQGARSKYSIVDVDRLGIVFTQSEGGQTMIPFEIAEEWVDYIVKNPTAKNIASQQLASDIKENYPTKYSGAIHSFHSLLKPMALEMIENGVVEKTGLTSLLVPVGADWTNSEHLLGYPDALQPNNYVMPDTGVLKLLLDARDNPNLPFFLILDEMNLSHVERYFADFLSAMESGEDIKLYDGETRKAGDVEIPKTLKFPKNLFVIGTMNVDETTYMFSPKVLDRAQVIEFRVSADEMKNFLENPTTPDLDAISGKGAKYAESFLRLKNQQPELSEENKKEIANALNGFFPELSKLGAEFGYRTAGEVVRFCAYYLAAGASIDDAIDAAIVQKLLPKLHGSQARLAPVLKKLKELSSETTRRIEGGEEVKSSVPKYKLTCEKIDRMLDRLKANGFTSFAEA